VPIDQPGARLVLHMFEPALPDSLVQWGMFNAVFERKEYMEPYVLEQAARDMLAADPALRAAFDAALAADPGLAAGLTVAAGQVVHPVVAAELEAAAAAAPAIAAV
jgi:hypothetical protein